MVDKQVNESILGCFASMNNVDLNGDLFNFYLWEKPAIANILKSLIFNKYGYDMETILFKFYINPIPYLLEHLKEIENYRRNEKSIGIPIIVTNDNFFNKAEAERWQFLKNIIMQKLDVLEMVVKKKKLDTNMQLLKADVKEALSKMPTN